MQVANFKRSMEAYYLHNNTPQTFGVHRNHLPYSQLKVTKLVLIPLH